MSDAKPDSSGVMYRKRLPVRRSLKIILRNSIFAALGRIVIGLLKLIAKRGVSKKLLIEMRGEVLSLDPLKWAAVFGGFSSFHLVRQMVSRIGSLVRLRDKGITLISGCICSLPVLVMNKDTRTEMCLYSMIRALHTFSLCFVLPRLPICLQSFEHYDVLLMCLSSSQISYAFLFCPSSLPNSYFRFLLKASMCDADLVRGHSNHLKGHTSPEMVRFCDNHQFPLLSDYRQSATKVLCQYSHPHMSCNMWALTAIPKSILQLGIPLYAPLRMIAILLTQRKKLLSNPVRTIHGNCRSVLNSSLFLALYISWILRSTCFGVRSGSRGGALIAVMSFGSGLATLLEPKSRRMDLALYCSMYALRSFILTQNKMGRLPYPRHWFSLLVYLVSMSFLFFEFEEEPRLVNNRVRTTFDFLLGDKASSLSKQEEKHRQPSH